MSSGSQSSISSNAVESAMDALKLTGEKEKESVNHLVEALSIPGQDLYLYKYFYD
jgi:hypothetical protein